MGKRFIVDLTGIDRSEKTTRAVLLLEHLTMRKPNSQYTVKCLYFPCIELSVSDIKE